MLGLVTSCSGDYSKKDADEKVVTAQNPQKMTDESKLIHDKLFRNAMLQPCLSQQTFERQTSHGGWYKLKNCNLNLNGIELKNKEISIHKGRKGKIDGIEFLIYPDTEYGSYLRQKAPENVVVNESKTCVRYYRDTFPVVTIVDELLCDAIYYGQI